MGFRTAPAGQLGYFRASDWPTEKGAGPAMQSDPTVSPGINGGSSLVSGWHPTVLWMLGFVVTELIVFHLLSRFMNI